MSADPERVTKDIRKALYRENYERAESVLVGKHLRRDDVVLEIGGGVGLVSLLCARKCGAEKVHTFEPNPKAVEAIKFNYRLNGMEPNITRAALSLQDGEIEFFMNDNIFSSSLIERENGKAVSVPTMDIRKVIENLQPTVVVMDVEGAELQLLPHTTGPNIRAMLVELHPHIVGEQAVQVLIETMAEKGYSITDRIDEKVVMFTRGSTD